jgi:hypothetical protein
MAPPFVLETKKVRVPGRTAMPSGKTAPPGREYRAGGAAEAAGAGISVAASAATAAARVRRIEAGTIRASEHDAAEPGSSAVLKEPRLSPRASSSASLTDPVADWALSEPCRHPKADTFGGMTEGNSRHGRPGSVSRSATEDAAVIPGR